MPYIRRGKNSGVSQTSSLSNRHGNDGYRCRAYPDCRDTSNKNCQLGWMNCGSRAGIFLPRSEISQSGEVSQESPSRKFLVSDDPGRFESLIGIFELVQCDHVQDVYESRFQCDPILVAEAERFEVFRRIVPLMFGEKVETMLPGRAIFLHPFPVFRGSDLLHLRLQYSHVIRAIPRRTECKLPSLLRGKFQHLFFGHHSHLGRDDNTFLFARV
jgi:hypothetical protein